MVTVISNEGGFDTSFKFNASDLDFIAKLVKEQDIPHEEEGDIINIYASSQSSEENGPIIDVEWSEIEIE